MTKIYGLLGRKLGHSYSVPIHAAFGNPDYRLIELEPEELEVFLAREDIGALNVTIPYKREVMRCCHVLSEEAEAIGSVNTLVKRDGKLWGYNSDAHGFLYMVRRTGIEFRDKKVVVFGSGGASRTVQAVAARLGAAETVVISRQGPDHYGNLFRHRDGQILINTTPVGMYPNVEETPVSLDSFPACEGVLDLIYNPLRTRLVAGARERGIPAQGGLPMLVAQAKMAEELFFQKSIPEKETARILGELHRGVENIVLIGMPGCGKNTVGAILAELSGREIVDIDGWIERDTGLTIPEIFRRGGEAEFRRLEREKTAEAGQSRGAIILTGGGVVKDANNAFPLRCNGRIYHIERAAERLAREGRPLSEGADLQEMYGERLPLYRSFRDVAVDNNGSPEAAAQAIWREFNENTRNQRA